MWTYPAARDLCVCAHRHCPRVPDWERPEHEGCGCSRCECPRCIGLELWQERWVKAEIARQLLKDAVRRKKPAP